MMLVARQTIKMRIDRMKRVFSVSALCAAATIGALAYAGTVAAGDEMGATAKAAAAFCTESGGMIETVDAAEGRADLCVLSDGTKVEAIQHLADSVAAGAADDKLVAVTKAAATFCKERGGMIETVSAAEGKTDLCVMPDGSKAEASQYMSDNASN